MTEVRKVSHIPLCWVGMHASPPPRHPHGPVVADCPCCGKTCYFFGLSAYGLGGPPILMPVTVRPMAQLAH